MSTVAPISNPEVFTLSGKETIDGESHEVVRSVVWFTTEQERDRFEHCGARFQRRVAGRTFYGTEMLVYC